MKSFAIVGLTSTLVGCRISFLTDRLETCTPFEIRTMGQKGDRQTREGAQFSEELLPRLKPLGEVSSRKMFGGYGLFLRGKMFALISSDAELYLKVDDSNRARFRRACCRQHGKMPYFCVPQRVLADTDNLLEWVDSAV